MGGVQREDAVRSYRDLVVWQKGMALAEDCYRLTRTFPREEMYGLVGQIRRAAASVPANIAEGQGREQTGTFIQFLRISQGSLKELETHLLLSSRVELTDDSSVAPLLAQCDGLGRMLRALIRSLEQR